MHSMRGCVPHIAMAAASMWIVWKFLGTFFEKKRNTFLSVSAWIFYFFFQVYFQVDAGNPNIITLPLTALLLLNIAVWGYHSTWKVKAIFSVMFCAVWLLMEMFTLVLISRIPMEPESFNMLGSIISKILMIFLVYIVSIFWNKKYDEAIPGLSYLAFLFLPAGSIFIALYLFYSKGTRSLSMLSVSVLLLFNVVTFELYIKMNELFLQEKERIVYIKQSDIILANLEEQKKMIEDFHEEKHNMLNQLVVLKSQAENCKAEDVIRSLDQIINNCNHTDNISNCGNSTIDAIINFKYSIAKEHNIDFRLNVFVPEEFPIEQRDIGVVLGNALDNAIEAAKECDLEERYVEISMRTKKSAWIVVMKNHYNHVIERDKRGKIVSSKKGKDRHGYGLKSIVKIAEKYQGDVVIDDSKRIFSLTIVMNFREI